MQVGFKLLLVTLLVAAILLSEVDCGKKNKKENELKSSKKGKENKVSREKKYSYTESHKLKERKLKVKPAKRSAVEKPLQSKKVSPEQPPLSENRRVVKVGDNLKRKPATTTEKIIEQIVNEELVIDQLPEDIEEVVVEVEEPVDESLIPEAEEEALEETAADINETSETYISDGDNVEVEIVEELELDQPIKIKAKHSAVAEEKVVAQNEEEAEQAGLEIEPVSSKKAEIRSRKDSASPKKKAKKIKSDKSKRKTEL